MHVPPLILVVDDEQDLLEVMSIKLKSSGFDVLTASGGLEAVAKAKDRLPDLILMDIRMPDVSGIDASLTLKQDPLTRSIKIAFLSSLRDPWPAMAGGRGEVSQELGMEAFLDKGEDLNIQMQKIKDILAKRSGSVLPDPPPLPPNQI